MRNLRGGALVTAVGVAMVASLVCLTAGSAAVTAAGDDSLNVFLSLPVTNGYSDATEELVETKELLRQPLAADPELRLVDRVEDADVVLTVLGRGVGDRELTLALRRLSRSIVSPPVPIARSERYIEILLTTGPCRTTPTTIKEEFSAACYRRIFVGVGFGDLDARRSTRKPRSNSWEACAEDVIKDVRVWLTTNAERLRTQRTLAIPVSSSR